MTTHNAYRPDLCEPGCIHDRCDYAGCLGPADGSECRHPRPEDDMTPLDLAQNLARSEDRHAVILGVAIVTRGLTDDDPHDATRMPWPLNAATIERAAKWLDVTLTPAEVGAVAAAAPGVSDAMLNRSAAR